MTDTDAEKPIEEEDRLPWLEAVDTDEEEEGVSMTKLLGFLLVAVIALGLVVGGVSWLRSQKQTPTGDGTLIAAQEGDYKVKPNDPGGMTVEGQGDATFAASEGAEANGQVDLTAQPEAPVTGTKVTPAPVSATGGQPVVTTVMPPSGGKLAAPAPARPVVTAPAPAPAAGGAGMIQLGAYGSQATADAAWATLGRKIAGLGGLAKSVAAANVNGSTVYRLRASTGSAQAAAAMCAKVSATGSPCMVVR